MDKILERYTRAEIANVCAVTYRTVLNWIARDTMPLWALHKLGFTVAQIKKGVTNE